VRRRLLVLRQKLRFLPDAYLHPAVLLQVRPRLPVHLDALRRRRYDLRAEERRAIIIYAKKKLNINGFSNYFKLLTHLNAAITFTCSLFMPPYEAD
jgi:hypothetical protein